MKISVIITLKKDVLDPQGKVVQQTLQNMGMDTLKNLRQGKYFEIEINENNEVEAKNKVENTILFLIFWNSRYRTSLCCKNLNKMIVIGEFIVIRKFINF